MESRLELRVLFRWHCALFSVKQFYVKHSVKLYYTITQATDLDYRLSLFLTRTWELWHVQVCPPKQTHFYCQSVIFLIQLQHNHDWLLLRFLIRNLDQHPTSPLSPVSHQSLLVAAAQQPGHGLLGRQHVAGSIHPVKGTTMCSGTEQCYAIISARGTHDVA